MRIYRHEDIEQLAEQRLRQLEQALDQPLAPPLPIDLVAEKVLGLDFLYEPIDELPGEIIFGGLRPNQRQIVLNEKRLSLFRETPGLERFTKGHEMGHWDLFVDKGLLDQPTLFGSAEDGLCVYRSAPAGEVAVMEECLRIWRQMMARADDPREARAVNRYAAALLMPRDLIRQAALKVNRTDWPNLYRLAAKFAVSITALVVRLEQLDLLYVGRNKELFESKAHASGQLGFGF